MEEKAAFRLSDLEPLCLLNAVLQNLWMVVASALVFVMAASLYLTWFFVPRYSAAMTYAVTAKNAGYYPSRNVTAAAEVAAVMTELLESDIITENIREKYDALRDFDGVLTAAQVGESNFIHITATAETPEQAFLCLKALVETFPVMSEYISDSAVATVVSNPAVSAAPSNGVNTRALYRLSALLGAGLMLALLLWVNISLDTIQTGDGARRRLDARLVCSIGHEVKNRSLKSRLKRSGGSLLISSPTVSFSYTEQIYGLRSRVEEEQRQTGARVFLITSVGENEGKSTIAANLAVALAQKGQSVALIDADLRKPSQAGIFGAGDDARPSLAELLGQPLSLQNLSACLRRDADSGLDLLLGKKGAGQSAELLSSDTFVALLDHLRRTNDFVVIDSPPLGLFPDAEVLADSSDACLLVVRQSGVPARSINEAIEGLRRCGAAFLGFVLNDMRGLRGGGYARYGRYGEKYGYGGGRAKTAAGAEDGSKEQKA